MSIKKDNISVTAIKYNSQDVNKVILDNKCVWCKAFIYTQGTLPTGVESLTCRRSSTDEPTASTGEISNNGTIYYDDKLYWAAAASAGYRITYIRGSNSPVIVSGDITGTIASELTLELISGTISQGTLPAGVASITCYRKAYNSSSFSEYTGSTIYYGDQFYWTATAAAEYNNPSLTYNNSSKVYTWIGSQNGSIDSVSASGLVAGSRKSFTISFGTTANKTLYGSWNSSSQTAYYGDKITVSGNSVICYKWDNNSTARWTVKVTASSNDAQYTYSAVTIAESSIASVTAEATFTAYNTRTLNAYTITWKYLSAYPDTWTTATQTYNYGATPSRTSPSTVTNMSNNERKIFTSWDNLDTVVGNRTITANYKPQFAPTIESNYCIANRNSNQWYDPETVITWTANDNYSFGGSTVKDTITTKIEAGNTTYSATPGYIKCAISSTNCHVDKTDGDILAVGDIITWTRLTGTYNKYSFSDTDPDSTTETATVELGKTSYDKTAPYNWYNVRSVNGFNCSAYTSSSYEIEFRTGWHLAGTKIYWKAIGDAYAMTTSNETTLSVEALPGNNNRSAVVKRYKLTISATNGSYGTYSVSRTSSPYQGAATGALSNGDTIFYGDVLKGTSSAKAASYDNWNINSVPAPTFTTTGDATSGNLTITNKSSYQATLYYNTSNAVGGTSAGTAAANGSKTVSGLSFNTQYYISARVSRTRTKYTYATDGDQYSGTNGVTGNVTATFKFKYTTSTDTGTIDSSVVAAKTATQNQYTITWNYMSAYDSWTTATQSYSYGATPSRSLPDAVYNGSYRRFVALNWDDLSQVTGNRTITCTYKHQIYYGYDCINCEYYSGTVAGWYDGQALDYSTTFTSNSGYAFDSSGSLSKTYSGTVEGSYINPNASYIKITASSTNTNCFLSTRSGVISGSTTLWVTSSTTVYAYAKLKSFVYSVPSTWSLQSGTGLCPNALYRVSSGKYSSPITIDCSATITVGKFSCAHKNTSYDNKYSISQSFNATRWSSDAYYGGNWLNVHASCPLTVSNTATRPSIQTYEYYNTFNTHGPITVSFKAEYTNMMNGLNYQTPTYVLYRVAADGTMTSYTMIPGGGAKNLTTDYLWVLTMERPEGTDPGTDTTTT